MENETWWIIGAILFAAASEIIGMLPIKSNSVVQTMIAILGRVFTKRG